MQMRSLPPLQNTPGFDVMAPLAQFAIDQALKKKQRKPPYREFFADAKTAGVKSHPFCLRQRSNAAALGNLERTS
jgi:hypothetical protein